MLALLGDLLSLGVAIAISPLSIVAVILMATAGKGRTNGTAFILGSYTFAVLFLGLIAWFGRANGTDEIDSGPHITVDVIEMLLGVGLLALAIMEWRKRSDTEEPKWMSGLDSLNMWKAFGLGVLIAGPLSPKDLPLLIAAGGRISQAHLPADEVIGVIFIFAAIGIVGVVLPWLISVISPSRVEAMLSGLRHWLVANHAVIMTVLFIVLGFKLIGAGVADLAR